MHVAFVITRADAIGGATVHVRDLAAALIESGHQATVLVSGMGAVTDQLRTAKIPFVVLKHLRRAVNPMRDVLAVREMLNELRRIQPDLVSAHTAKAGCVARLACIGMDVPVLYTPHGWSITDRISRMQGLIYRQVERLTAPLTSVIVNVCEQERELAIRHGVGLPTHHRVIYNGMPDIAPLLRADPMLEPCKIVMVARFERPKDHATLIHALAQLQHLAWDLELAGDGPGEAGARGLVESLGMSGRVRFLGAVKSAAPVLAEGQLFVLSSRSEGFPRSILEAMRAGLPVIASEVGGVSEAVLHGNNGYVVKAQSVEQMRAALESLIQDPFLRAAYGAAGRSAYEEKFLFSRMLDETFSLYEQLTDIPENSLQRREQWQPQLR